MQVQYNKYLTLLNTFYLRNEFQFQSVPFEK